jgi:hypothetical protein
MAFVEKENTGALFKNDKRADENQWPHCQGSLNVRGEEFWLSAYLNTSRDGVKYMSLVLKPKNADAVKPKNETAKTAGGAVPFDDEIPFAPEWR